MSKKNEGINITRNNDGSFTSKISGVRLFEMVQYVTGFLEGSFDDWPGQIQDPIYAALERKADEVELPLTIVHSSCQIDYGDKQDKSEDRFYLYVVASEIVAADERTMKNLEIEKAVKEIMAGRTVQ